jgi:Tol biopolymer transport system component
MSRPGPEERLSAAQAVLERGNARSATRELSRARLDFLAQGDLSGLTELLAVARELPTGTPREKRAHHRLVYEAEQDIAFLSRRAALTKERSRSATSSRRMNSGAVRKNKALIATLGLLALAVAVPWLILFLAGLVGIVACVRLLWKRDSLGMAFVLQALVFPVVGGLAYGIVLLAQSSLFVGPGPDPRWVNAVARIGVALWGAGLGAIIVVHIRRGGRTPVLVPVACLATFLVALAVGATAFGPRKVVTRAPLPGERNELARLGLIAYERGNDIWVVRADGTGARAITSDRAEDTWPVWSPDGTRLAFMRSPKNRPTEIVVVAIDGRKIRRLATIKRGINPTWSPDGRQIAFEQERGETNAAIEIAETSSGRVQRTLSSGDAVYEPAWSPDGSWIAFVRSGDLVVVHPDGSSLHALVRGRAGFGLSDLAWSPDGDRIAFVAQNGEEPGEVDSVTLDGERVRLAPTKGHLSQFTETPSWSPDGDNVLFTTWYAWELGSDFAIMKARAYGGGADTLVDQGGYDAWPTWAQDGSWIAFVSARDTEADGQDLYVMRANGKDVRRLTFTAAITENDPAWQPRRAS